MTDTSSLVSIGRFSALTRISVRMLRHYDAHGVLVPAHVDAETGYRSYAPTQVGDAMVVRQLRDVGFGVPAIGALLATRGSATYARALEQQRAVLVDERRAAQYRLDLIDRMREAHQKELTMSITIDEHTFAARHVVALRGTVPTYADEQLLWDRFFPELGKQQITPSGVCGSIDLADEYQEDDVDKEVFFEVGADATAAEPLAIRDLPAQRAARASLTGPYSEIGDACDQLVRWATERGKMNPGAGGMRYLYLNDVRTTPPEELITEIYLPIGD